jgi:death-on-curing protein
MRWLRSDAVQAIHKRQIAEHGGQDGLRDVGLLESALARPLNIHAYRPEADIADLAAAYAFGIIKNHPFIDGNKRTGYVVMETFILLNGNSLTATQQEKYMTIITVADGNSTEDELSGWIGNMIVEK